MAPRPVLDAIDMPRVRPSARVATIARLLDDEPSQIRRMIARGELEAHRVGIRGVRIFLDSVEEWQRTQRLGAPKARREAAAKAPPARSAATSAAHRQAMAHLRRLGVV